MTQTTNMPTVTVQANELEKWLHMYQQMLTIRIFEEQVNELYQTGQMPGLAHLYSGEEAVAVGVCEALRRDERFERLKRTSERPRKYMAPSSSVVIITSASATHGASASRASSQSLAASSPGSVTLPITAAVRSQKGLPRTSMTRATTTAAVAAPDPRCRGSAIDSARRTRVAATVRRESDPSSASPIPHTTARNGSAV